MSAPVSTIGLPRVTLNIVKSNTPAGLQQQRALVLGQIAPAVKASGTIIFSGQPTANDTITFNGTAWTFVASGASGAQSNIGGSLAVTLASLAAGLNASVDTQLVKFSYFVVGTMLLVVAKTGGTGGNSLTLAKSCSVATLSAATLAGGAAAPGSATGGALSSSLPVDAASMNALFGAGSHLAMIANAFRDVNKVTVMDALPLADASTATQASAQIAFAGTATVAGTLFVDVVNGFYHHFEIDAVVGDTAATILTKLRTAIAAASNLPFTMADDALTTMQFLALSGGTHANTWLLDVLGSVPGITVTLTGWAGGATNPSLTGLFTPIGNIRYQTIVWPEAYAITTVGTFLDGRKNVDNGIMEGRAFVYKSEALSSAQTDAASVNSSEVVVLNNVATSQANWYGPHIPAAPDTLAARFAAARARRFEVGISIADLVTVPSANDQFGGPATASLPYFNTPILNVAKPAPGTGYVRADQRTLEANGVTVLGLNPAGTAVIAGPVVTTWTKDGAGNPDTTWKYLEWRDTHGVIREYLVLNCQAQFSQYRLSNGDVVSNYAMATQKLITGFILGLCDDLMRQALIQAGQKARQFIQNNMTVTLSLATRSVSVSLLVPTVSQLEEMTGTVAVTFSFSAS